MTARELINELLHLPDLDLPIVIYAQEQFNEINCIDYQEGNPGIELVSNELNLLLET